MSIRRPTRSAAAGCSSLAASRNCTPISCGCWASPRRPASSSSRCSPNLTRLRDDTLRFAADAGIRFATSVYSDDPAVYNAITKVGAGTLYGALTRLEAHGLVEALPAAARRRPYRLTAAGATLLQARLSTLDSYLAIARARLVAS